MGIFDSLAALFGGSGLLPPFSDAQAQPANAPQTQPPPIGMLDRLGAGTRSFLGSSNPIEGLVNGIGGLASGKRTDPGGVQQEAIRGMLNHLVSTRKISPTDAQFLAANPSAWGELSKAMINQPITVTPSGDILRQGPFGQLSLPGAVPISEPKDVVNSDGSRSPGFAIKPSLVNPNGGFVIPGQPAPRPASAPNGGRGQPSINPAYDGITQGQADRVNRPAIITEMSPAERNAQEKRGTMQGEAQFNYPAAISAITSTIDNIRGLRATMDKPTGSGMTIGDANLGAGRGVGWLAAQMGAEGSSDFRTRLGQLASRTWMAEIKNMVGMGALSNAEGSRVEQAAARLQTSQNPKVFRESLDELERTLSTGIARARLQAFGRQQLSNGGGAPLPSPPQGFTVQ